MIAQGLIFIQGCNYSVIDAVGETKDNAGKVVKRTALKIIRIKDMHSALEVHVAFSVDEFAEFISRMEGGKIITLGPQNSKIVEAG